MFDQFEQPSGSRILELGCGPGGLWTENLDCVPQGWSLTLTDASPSMVDEAQDCLGSDRRFALRVVDAQDLPFESDAFDAVVANHVLYHVPDRSRVFSEMVRVLRPGGHLYAASNGEGHMREMGRMLGVLDPMHPAGRFFRAAPGFSLENATEQLSPWFAEVSLRRYEDVLVVTETKALADYLLSGTVADAARKELDAGEFGRRATELVDYLERELASRGEIRITKDAGLFLARG